LNRMRPPRSGFSVAFGPRACRLRKIRASGLGRELRRSGTRASTVRQGASTVEVRLSGFSVEFYARPGSAGRVFRDPRRLSGFSLWGEEKKRVAPGPESCGVTVDFALLIQGLFSSARGAEPVFRLFRYQVSPWRCGAGFKFDMSLRARCPLFFSREKRAGGPLRGGAGRGSSRRCRCELHVGFLIRARSELGGPSVAVRGGVQLGGVCTSSMSRAPKKISKAVPLAAPNG
jgi:hypothetical protein